ncbi:MAG: N-6 DNA methylase [Chloroflexota bacterium]|nr:N-6 DNA methylase [Chloroflexota bacterium]MDE2961502.1 N-6 DNA methylase [Chloroflexota bacterium]
MEVQEVKNIVGTARDLLVGKVPLPVDQCQEITRALIYKFLSAEDAASMSLGGEASYFTGQHAECRWDRLMSPERTANNVDRLYREGMARLGQADVMPAVRTIYQDAYIPYNDPIILRDFLRAIDRFDTADTEKIGDAYEMLLQDLGAQASAGQFRTPRHIIDFIVAIIDPQKHETILDPACGTGGFLASAWEYINRAGRLSAADRGNLARNLVGYDISPTMEMLSTVNLFLHHRQQPSVSVYDTLTSEERWNDHYDVILANPPFMSPKGGIRPHGRFFSRSKRSEVLFVDYIMGHLNDSGRAGIIVPEGVIFQSQRAHTQLRRLLVETALVAVISLPGGVFNPYSGVKTSILILDKALAPKTRNVAFFKVENDGYDLGAQRRPIGQDDLPAVADEINEYLRRLRAGEPLDDFAPQKGLLATKARVAEDGEYNLSGERYRSITENTSQYPTVKLGEPGLFAIVSGGTPKSDEPQYWDGDIPWITLVDLPADDFISEIKTTERTITDAGLARSAAKIIPADSVVVSSRATIGRVGINRIPLATNQGFKNIVIEDTSRAMAEYVALAVTKLVPEMQAKASGATYKEITKTKFADLEIPLPPLEVQREIVAEIEGYQRVIGEAYRLIEQTEREIMTAITRVWDS